MHSNNDRPRSERNLPALQLGSRTITAYDPGVALAICEKVADGAHLKDLLDKELSPDMPCRATWYRWCLLYPELKSMYERAREISAEGLEEEALEVSKKLLRGEMPDMTPLRLDEIKTGLTQHRWSASRRDPAKFGERHMETPMIPIQINTSLNLGQDGATVKTDTGSIYNIKVTRQTPEPEEDAEEAEVSPFTDVVAAIKAPGKPRGRPRKGHKTPAQIRATLAAQSKRGRQKE